MASFFSSGYKPVPSNEEEESVAFDVEKSENGEARELRQEGGQLSYPFVVLVTVWFGAGTLYAITTKAVTSAAGQNEASLAILSILQLGTFFLLAKGLSWAHGKVPLEVENTEWSLDNDAVTVTSLLKSSLVWKLSMVQSVALYFFNFSMLHAPLGSVASLKTLEVFVGALVILFVLGDNHFSMPVLSLAGCGVMASVAIGISGPSLAGVLLSVLASALFYVFMEKVQSTRGAKESFPLLPLYSATAVVSQVWLFSILVASLLVGRSVSLSSFGSATFASCLFYAVYLTLALFIRGLVEGPVHQLLSAGSFVSMSMFAIVVAGDIPFSLMTKMSLGMAAFAVFVGGRVMESVQKRSVKAIGILLFVTFLLVVIFDPNQSTVLGVAESNPSTKPTHVGSDITTPVASEEGGEGQIIDYDEEEAEAEKEEEEEAEEEEEKKEEKAAEAGPENPPMVVTPKKHRNINLHCEADAKLGSEHFVVWTYPFPPNNHDLCDYEKVLCGYRSCSELVGENRVGSLNLRTLSDEKRFEKFIRHHMWMKMVHLLSFPKHIQAVAMLLVLENHPGACVRMLGEEKRFCSVSSIQGADKYDPTQKDASVPAALLPTDEVELPEHFATLDYYTRSKSRARNSGDQLQSLSGLQFMPYLSDFVDRDQGIPTGKGYIFGNAWWGVNAKWPPGKDLHITMFSAHYSRGGLKLIRGKADWFKEVYNSFVGAVGARDYKTLAILQSLGIRSYFSACFTTMINMGYRAPQYDGERTEIYVVDAAVDKKKLPQEVQDKAIFRSVKMRIPKGGDHMDPFEYAYDDLAIWSRKAKLVITSRIHSALPSMAQGVPVVFVQGGEKRLPGGPGGRTAGLQELFHEWNPATDIFPVDINNPAPNPGIQKVDRLRASFWNYLIRRTPYYEDTGRLFGVVPLKRLHHMSEEEQKSVHSTFHFVTSATPDQFSWRMIRAVEQVFFHHPDAEVFVHSNSLPLNFRKFQILNDASYKVSQLPVDVKTLLSDFGSNAGHQAEVDAFLNSGALQNSKLSDGVEELTKLLILQKYGGVYLDLDMHLLQQVSIEMKDTGVFAAHGSAVMMFEKGSKVAESAIVATLKTLSEDCVRCGSFQALSQQKEFKLLDAATFFPYSADDAHKCFGDADDTEFDTSSMFGVGLFERDRTSKFLSTSPGTFCDDVFHKYCIFCDEVHTDEALP